MPDDRIYLTMPHKQIELWGITATSGNFRPYPIQTANIHFNVVVFHHNLQALLCVGDFFGKDSTDWQQYKSGKLKGKLNIKY